MTNFVDDNTDLDFPKDQARVTAPGFENKTLRASDWNRICQAAYDLRAKYIGGVQQLRITNTITPPSLPTGTTENWNPTGLETAGYINVQTNEAGSTIGGLVAPTTGTIEGRIIVLLNHGNGSGSRGTSPLIIKHRSSGSDAVNLIVCPDLTDIELPYTGGALLKYEGNGVSTGSWLVVAMSTGGRWLRTTIGDLWLKGNFPAALAAGNNNDWSPVGWVDHTVHEVLVNTGAVLTGLNFYAGGSSPDPYQNTVYQAGIVKIIVNRSDGVAIKVLHDSSSSSVLNRIYSAVGDFEIPPKGSCIFIYDYSSARWRAAAGWGIGAVSKLSTYAQELDTLADGNNNNWNPTNFSSIGTRKIQVGAASVLTGMQAQETGAIRTLVAFGSFTIKNQDANSSANNRIYLPSAYQAGGLALASGDSVTFRYDAVFTNWVTIAIAK